MKVIGLLLLLAGPASAALVDLGGVADLLAEKAKEAKGASTLNLKMEVSGALYLPIVTLHSKQPGLAGYADFGLGGELLEGGRTRPAAFLGVNVLDLGKRILYPVADRLTWAKLPPIWVGPFLRAPTSGGPWVIGREVGGFISIRLGGK